MRTVKTSLFILTCIFCVAACGLKGPLYLPAEETNTQLPVEEGTEAAEDNEKETKEKKKDSDSR